MITLQRTRLLSFRSKVSGLAAKFLAKTAPAGGPFKADALTRVTI